MRVVLLNKTGHDSARGVLSRVKEVIPEQKSEQGMVSDNGIKIPDSQLIGNTNPSYEELYNLAQSLREQFERLGQLDDIDKAIEHGTRALDMAPNGHPVLPECHAGLAISYAERFWGYGHLNDLDKAVEHDCLAVALTPDSDPNLSQRHAQLGLTYRDRFQRLGALDDLQKSIEHRSRALELTPEGHPELPDRYGSLGVAYGDRFQRLGEMDDLEKAIKYDSYALASTPDDHPKLARRHANLGASYGDRFQRLGKLEDLQKSIDHDSRALALTPDGDPDLPRRHAQLGISYRDRFRHLGELIDIERSINHKTRALLLTPEGHPALPGRHAALGVTYSDRYKRLGGLADLEKAIEYDSSALELTPDSHPDLPGRHNNLAIAYADRFWRLGDLEDLEKAIEHSSAALALTPKDHPGTARRHANLGASYHDRFWHLGELADLEKAVSHISHALALTPDGHPELPRRHAILGISYRDRFRRLGELKDLEKAIKHMTCALEMTPEGRSDLSDRHANLGITYTDRFWHLGKLDDLEKAIEHKTRALELTPDDHPDLSHRHARLGVSFSDRFKRLDDLSDLERSIDHFARALASTPDGHPDLSERHFRQAEALFLRYQHTSDPSHLQCSLDSFCIASRTTTGAPRDRFHYALRWADLSSKHSPLKSTEAYQTAIDLLPQFIWLGATTRQRYLDMLTAENLAVNAAYAAILQSDYRLALNWLEHGRCVVWNQTLMLRSPVDDLQTSHPKLGTRLQTIAKQLHDITSTPYPSQAAPSNSVESEHSIRNRLRLAREYNDVLSKARKLPGFEDFLQPTKSRQLVHAARYGPVVVINCHEECCDALLISPGEGDIKCLRLPNFTAGQAQKARSELQACLRRKGLRERGVKMRSLPGSKDSIASVLLTLWENLVKPILDCLGYIDNPQRDPLPHVTWCPSGAASFLPLHAAGDYESPGSRAFDHAISSYTPTLTALLASNPGSLNSTSRVLAIGQANTPGHRPLPGTTKELEYLTAHAQTKVEYTQLTGDQATTTTVLDAMEQHEWVHLACHAHQNIVDPTKSGFFLHDGTLDLAAINRRSFKNKGLAFLSACQTAMGDEKLPDEAIHLASGMLMAGYPSVIGTMWSVSDSDAPFVADKVYGQLMKGGKVGSGEAGRALHCAVGELRAKVGEKEFARWVPYIHVGS